MTRTESSHGSVSQTPWRVAGGPLGRHTTDRARSVAGWAGILVGLTALPVLIALALRGWCLVNGFGGQVPLWRACYSDLPAMLGTLRSGEVTGDPVITAAVMKVLATVVSGEGTTAQSVFVILYAFLALLLLAVCAVAVAAYRAEEPERALMFVLCPALPLGLLVSADLVGVTLAVLALLAWRLRYDATAGALIVLAVFSRSYALILAVVLVALAVRTGRDLRRLGLGSLMGLGAVGMVTAAMGWQWITTPLTQWWNAVPSYGSVWMLPDIVGTTSAARAPWLESLRQLFSSVQITSAAMAVITVIGWVAAAVLVVWLARRRGRPLADVALAGTAVVLLVSSALPVQASLWLVPLVALSTLPWRDMLIWAGAEVLYFPMVWLYLGGLQNPERGLPGGWYALFLVIRVLAIGYLVWRASQGSSPRRSASAAASPVPAAT